MLSIITVNYNSRIYLKKLISSIYKHLPAESFECIIVNNDPYSLSDFMKNQPYIKIIEKNVNIGFGRACNLGAKNATNDWLFFINPDAELQDNSVLSALNYAKENLDVGLVGPQIIQASTKKPQPWSCGKKTSLFQIFFKNTFRKAWNNKQITEVDWVSGTAFIISRSNFQAIKGFDEDFFMYYEDQDLCLRLKSLEKKIILLPAFQVLHHNGKSWQTQNYAKKKAYFNSQDLFFKKHLGRLEYHTLRVLRRIIKGH